MSRSLVFVGVIILVALMVGLFKAANKILPSSSPAAVPPAGQMLTNSGSFPEKLQRGRTRISGDGLARDRQAIADRNPTGPARRPVDDLLTDSRSSEPDKVSPIEPRGKSPETLPGDLQRSQARGTVETPARNRRAAASRNPATQPIRPVEEVLKDFRSSSRAARNTAARELGAYPRPDIARELVYALGDADNGFAAYATQGLNMMRTAALDALVEGLNSPNPKIRGRCIHVIGNLGADAPLNVICKGINDPDANVAQAAIQAAGTAKCYAAAPTIVEKFAVVKPGPIPNIVSVLTTMDKPVVSVLRSSLSHENPAVRLGVAKTLVAINDSSAAAEFLQRVHDPSGPVRATVLHGLRIMNDRQATEAMLDALRDPEADVRREASLYFNKFKVAGVVDVLIQTLHDSDERVRLAAADSLGEQGDLRAVKPLLAMGARDDAGSVAAIAAMRRLGVPAGRILLPYLSDEQDNVRFAVANVLEKLDDETFTKALDDRMARRDLDAVAGGGAYFVSHATEDTVPVLVDALAKARPDDFVVAMANSMDKRLSDAAGAWLSKKGLMIRTIKLGQ